MQVTQTQEDGLKRAFTVVVPATELATRIEARLNDLAGQVQMPGFRPGKVPVKLMRQKYGDSVKGEVLQDVVNETSRQLLDERGLRPAMQPSIDVTRFEDDADLEYAMNVEVLPEIDPPDLAAIEIERLVIDIADFEIDEALGRIAEQHRSFAPVTDGRAAGDGDMVVVDFIGRIDGEAFEGGSGEGVSLHLGSGTFIPGFEEQLVGAKAGEARSVEVSFPDDYGAENLAGKAAVFDVKVGEVQVPV
ncbi:MAG: trigger factor, partial [Alphaproteobacteria bacterium]